MEEKENVLDIIRKTINAFEKQDAVMLKELSNRTIHTASIYHDPDNIAVAVLVYSLGKIVERKKYATYKEWPSFYNSCISNLRKAERNLSKDKLENFRKNMRNIRKSIARLSPHLKKYIRDVFARASINKASRIYEHGISLQLTSNLLGISPFELAEYAGKTWIADVALSITKPARERLKTAMSFFR
jgi:hypothetical protein